MALGYSGVLAQDSADQDTADQDAAARQAAQQAALAKANQNPVANMIMVPLEFWHNDGENGDGFTAVAKPVIPTPIGGMNLINRFILPYASISGTMQLPDTEFGGPAVDEKGLGDFIY